MNKELLRKEMLIKRKKITQKLEKSFEITNKIINLEKFKKAKVIAIYKNLKDEVNTNYLINYSLNVNKIVLLPRVVGNDIIFFKYQINDKLEESIFHILEPIYNIDNIYKDKIDLIIVPGICFDKYNNRLGYGRGYYDKFLKNKSIYKIGISYSDLLIDIIPTDKWDIKMNLIITEKTSQK